MHTVLLPNYLPTSLLAYLWQSSTLYLTATDGVDILPAPFFGTQQCFAERCEFNCPLAEDDTLEKGMHEV